MYHGLREVIDGIRSLYKKNIRARAWLDVNELVHDVLRMIDADLRTQQVSVSIDLRDRLPPLLGNRAQLEEVLVNLITNAIEAMDALTDRARLLQIRSDIIQERSAVVVTIEDSGTGIDDKNKARIFEPFFTTKSEGMGIGLGICRAIIESHNGNLHASANDPYGTIFSVVLPTGGVVDLENR